MALNQLFFMLWVKLFRIDLNHKVNIMNYSTNGINVLAAKAYKGIGNAWIIKNLKGGDSDELIVTLLNKVIKVDFPITLHDFQAKKRAVEEKLNKTEGFMDGLIAIGDANFPPYRGIVKYSEQPVSLFYRGDVTLLKATNKNVAVIGLLNPDNDTEIIEREVVDELVKNGCTIVSGLAIGCDTIAHIQALKSNGNTIAILPSPLNNILPAKNKELAIEIVKKNGLLITEYYEDAKSKVELGGRYQKRDRLQALFSDGVILSASYDKNDLGNDSGSRLAMEYALNYSIPRAVIYDFKNNINNPKYELSRRLIREQHDITIINGINLKETVRRLSTTSKNYKGDNTIQARLFS